MYEAWTRRHSTAMYHSNGHALCSLAPVHMHAGATRVTGQHNWLEPVLWPNGFNPTGAQQRCGLPHIDAVLSRNDGCIGGGTMYSLQHSTAMLRPEHSTCASAGYQL